MTKHLASWFTKGPSGQGKSKLLEDVLVKKDGKWVYHYEDVPKGMTRCPTCRAWQEHTALADPKCDRCDGEGYVCYECWWAKQRCTCPEETFRLNRKGCGF